MKVLVITALLAMYILMSVSGKHISEEDAESEDEDCKAKRTKEEKLKIIMDKAVKVTAKNVKNFCKEHPDLISCLDYNKEKKDISNLITECGRFQNLSTINSTDSSETNRVKRSSGYGDPCTNSVFIQDIMTHGLSEDGVLYELVQDPENGLYQTYYVKECNEQQAYLISGYDCTITEMKLETLVWIYQGSGIWTIENYVIVLPSDCHLHKQFG